jgi:GNAT superfamily N-acetyltransferase
MSHQGASCAAVTNASLAPRRTREYDYPAKEFYLGEVMVNSSGMGKPENRISDLCDLVREPDDRLFVTAYNSVLKPAFQADELEPLDVIRDQIIDGSVLQMLVALDESHVPVGVITADWYSRGGVALIGYLAIREDLRGQGLGTTITRQATERWAAELQPALSVAEVEDPRYFQASSFGDPNARLRLYERLGGRIIGLPYFQPRLTPESNRVYHLMLMAFTVGASPAAEISSAQVPTDPLVKFLEDYFGVTEGAEALTDPEFLALKAAYQREPTAALLRATELDQIPELDY